MNLTRPRIESVVAVVVCGAVFLLLWASIASADEPAPECTTAPSVYEGTDDVVHELRMLRIENAKTCAAAHADAIASRAQERDLDDQRAEALGEITDAINAQGTAAGTTSTVALSTEDRDRQDAMYGGIRNGIWFPVGIVAALFLVGGLFWGSRPDR